MTIEEVRKVVSDYEGLKADIDRYAKHSEFYTGGTLKFFVFHNDEIFVCYDNFKTDNPKCYLLKFPISALCGEE